MHSRRLTTLLLLPSLSSGIIVTCAGLLVVGYNAWTYIAKNQFFYDYLFGAYGLKTYIWQQSLQPTNWRNSFLGSPIAYYIFVAVAAVVAGLITYTCLQGTRLIYTGGRSAWQELGGPKSSRTEVLHALFGRLGLRVISLVAWAIYAAFFFSTLLPFCMVLNQTGIDHIETGQLVGWLDSAGAVVIALIGLHLHVVFLRLAFLRPRLFFGEQVIEEIESSM